MIEYIIIFILLAILVWKEYTTNKERDKLTQKIMAKNYQEYVYNNTELINKSTKLAHKEAIKDKKIQEDSPYIPLEEVIGNDEMMDTMMKHNVIEHKVE